MYLDVFTGYTELGATAFSNAGLDITSLIVKTGTVDTTTLGTYVINYSITVFLGNLDPPYRLKVVFMAKGNLRSSVVSGRQYQEFR